MRDKIVSLNVAPRSKPDTAAHAPSTPDPWCDQINARLTGIERLMARLEWQIWALVCGGATLLGSDLLRMAGGF